MPVTSLRTIAPVFAFSALLIAASAAPSQPSGQGNRVDGDWGERQWHWPLARRLDGTARRVEELRRQGKCEAFYRARNQMSINLANEENALHETAKFDPRTAMRGRETLRYYQGYYQQLMQLDCPPGSSLTGQQAPRQAVDAWGRPVTGAPPEQQSQTAQPPEQPAESAAPPAPAETPTKPAETAAPQPPAEIPAEPAETSSIPAQPSNIVLPGAGVGSIAGTYRLTLPAAESNPVTIMPAEGGYMLTGMGSPILLRQQGSVYVGQGTMFGESGQVVQLRKTGDGLQLTTSGADGRSTTASLAVVEQGQ